MADIKYVTITKTCVGSLTFNLVNPMTNARQIIDIPSDAKTRVLPLEWAALVYADSASGAYKLYKNGYFAFDNKDVVYKYALDHGYVIGDVENVVTVDSKYLDNILDDLKNGRTPKLKTIIEGSEKGLLDVVQIAREHVSELTQGVISWVEKIAKIQLLADGE